MDWQAALDAVEADIEPHIGTGRVADYIPALARVDARRFALAFAGIDGRDAAVGDADMAFSIQSISKVFTLTLALARRGEALFTRVGREPSGSAFNSIVQLEHEHGLPRNPFINAGAIAVTDTLLEGRDVAGASAFILDFMRDLAGDASVGIDEEVAASEAEWGFRNRSLGNFMKAFGVLDHPVEDVLAVYFRQCAIAMTARQLARASVFLADAGLNRHAGTQIVSPERSRRIAALMLTCGHYDASGEFAYRVGLPGKSGVGGGIIAIVPGEGALCAWGPGLNEYGNSLVGTLALERLAHRANLSVFD